MVVLITGISSGFGLETAKLLANEGHIVYGTVRREVEPLDGVHYLKVDVRDNEAVKAAVRQVIEQEGRIDVLVNNAGMGIGGPVWWGTYPQVMFSLFRDINLDGKTVVPFTTHEGSGLASCVSDVKSAFPKAKVTQGFSIYGHEVRTGKAKVEKWLKSL